MKITSIEIKKDKNGNDYKQAMFDTTKVFVFPKGDLDLYNSVVVGADFELVKDGNFWKIKTDKPTGNFPSKVEKLMDKKAENIEKAQDRKNESISYFNSLNSAISLVQFTIKNAPNEDLKDHIIYWRDWFLSEYRKYESGDYKTKHDAF